MFKIGDNIVYKKEVCKIVDIKYQYLNNLDYYILNPIADSSLKIQIQKIMSLLDN